MEVMYHGQISGCRSRTRRTRLTEFYLLAQQALEKSGSFMLPALYAGLQAPARRIYREDGRRVFTACGCSGRFGVWNAGCCWPGWLGTLGLWPMEPSWVASSKSLLMGCSLLVVLLVWMVRCVCDCCDCPFHHLT